MDMPPSRYRVVERGRRLIVVDSQTGAPITGLHAEDQARIDALKQRLEAPQQAPRRDPPPRPFTAPSSPPPPPLRAPGPAGLGDPGILTTQPWFDSKAPRRVRIAESNSTKVAIVAVASLFAVVTLFVMFDWPGLVVAAVILLNLRKPILAGITSWIDTLEAA
jgi:hypothetical protein